jgi:diacylglycerol kinase family enzyme
MASASLPRASLVVNPNAGRLSERAREEAIALLRSRFRADVHFTTARDSGITIASDLARSGEHLVIAFGGDGHVNEVANGVAGTDSVLGIVPGGTMNVFARALGIPLEAADAIDHLASRVDEPVRTVPLGRIDDRYFTFSAGCGFDAEAAERVERYVPSKRRFGEAFFYWSAFRVLTGTFRHRGPTMRIKGDFGEVEVAMAIVCNAGPYAYLAGRPVHITPQVSLDKGIDVFGLRRMRIEALPSYAWRVVLSGDLVKHPDAFYASDLDKFELVADQPFSRHVDGEPLAPARSARFAIERGVLKVRA